MGLAQGDWKKAIESQTVLGRFVEIEIDDPVLSRKHERKILRKTIILETKIAGKGATSAEISTQRVKPFNEDELRNRFPGAWESMMVREDNSIDKIIEGESGTPIDGADWIPPTKRAALKETGVTTIEMLAAMSDATVHDWGPGARSWRKKAAEFLSKPKG